MGIKLWQHSDQQLVREVPHRSLRAISEREMRILTSVETALEVAPEMSALVDREGAE